jgi:hypothetical protein
MINIAATLLLMSAIMLAGLTFIENKSASGKQVFKYGFIVFTLSFWAAMFLFTIL